MRIAGSLVALVLAALLPSASQHAAAAGPGIIILSPAQGATIHGRSLTVAVYVSSFRLVRPVFSHPPVLKGFAGSLQYILDSTANYQPRRDLSAATTHTWTHVPPGPHTIIVRLATGQHLPWPNGPVARVSVQVVPIAAPATRHHARSHHAGGASPGVGAAPTTGGAADLTHSSLNLTLILLAMLLLVLGFAFFGARLAFVPASGRRRAGTLTPSPVSPPVQALSVLPGEGADPSDPLRGSSESSGDMIPTSDPLRPQFREPSPVAAPLPHAAGGDYSGGAFTPEPETPPERPESEQLPRERAVEMARQWSGVVESLVRQLDEQEAERRRMLDHIRMLEEHMRSVQTARDQLRDASSGGMSPDDFQTLRYLTDALQRDPDHIVNLAAVAQHAAKFRALVEAYARLREALTEP